MTDAAGVVTTARMIAATLAKKIQDADQVPMVARTRVAADLPVVVGAKKNLRPMSATKTAAVAVAAVTQDLRAPVPTTLLRAMIHRGRQNLKMTARIRAVKVPVPALALALARIQRLTTSPTTPRTTDAKVRAVGRILK